MQLTKKLFQLSKIMIIAGLGVFLLTVGNAQAAGMIYYTQAYNPYEVRSASLTTPTAITSLYTSATGSPYAVVLDSVNKKIYFSDPHSSVSKVYQCNMDGSNRVDFISNIHAQGLAVDTDHGYLYATDVRNGNVVRKNLSGGSESIIYNDSDAVFRAIAVDSGNSYIYLADYKSGKIIRADLNGGDAADFMTGIYATGLAVDSVNSKLYYAVSRKPDFYVGRASLATGGSKETIYTSDTGSPRGLCVDNAGGYIYIADWHSSKHAIYRASLTGAANPTVFISNANTFGIAISQICTVTFDSKGGSTVPSAEVLLNGKVNQPVNPTRAAFYFDGWFEDAAYTNAWDFLNDNVIDDMTLHARWKSSRPVVSTSAIDVSFTENGVPVAVDNGIIVTDGDSTVLSSAAVSIITGFQSGSDILSFVNNNAAAMGNITGNYSAGVLSLVSSSATATLAQWQNALRAVTYNNTSQDPGGSRTVRLTVNDGNYTSQNADKTISITAVNTAPTIITPAGISVGESTATPLTGISFADADSGAANVTAVFSVSAGAFSGVNAGAVSVSGNGTGSFTMTGTISDINNYINASELVYTPVSGSLDSITLSIGINDGGNAGSGGAKTASATAVISISAVNDLPQITAPATIPVTENTASSLSGISFSDADSGSGAVDVILSVSSGALTAVSGNGVTVAGSGTTIVTLSGTVANINTLILSGVLKFTTAFNNKNNITLGITIDDKGNSGSGGAKNASATVILQVAGTNHAPTIGITPPLIVTEDVSTPLAGIIFADDDAGNAAVEAVFSVTSGAFAATAGGGVAVDNVTIGSIKLTGSITDINTYIQGDNVGYTTAADNTSAITLSLLVNDKGNTGAGGEKTASTTAAISVTPVNDPPTVAASLGKTGYIIGKGSVAVDNSLTVSDVDNLTLPSVNVSIGSGFQSSEDVLSFTNDGSMGNITGNYDPAQGALMLTSAGSTATLAQWQAALRSVRYNNTSATPDTTERTMQITANDGVQDSSGTNKHVTISQPVYFDISGTVKGSDTNQGIAATIQLKDNMGGNVGAAVPAAADGSYTITGVLAGTGYSIAVSMPGYTEGYITAFDVINANITGKDITLQKTAVPPVKVLTSIVVTPPAKTIYKIGQSLDTTGMIVIARYSDGSQAVVYGYSITGFSSAVAGTNTVTVSYGGKSAAFLVTISAKGLQNIILTAPVKTVYQIGDAFDSTGMKVTAVWDDNTTEDVTTIATISGFDSTTAGTKVITVIYGGKSSAFSIEVRGKTLSSLALIQPSKLTYVLGEAFDQSGLKVTARYADGSTEDVTAAVVLSGFDSSTAGIKTITVNYGAKNVTFTIAVQDKKVKRLTVIPPTKMEYLVGEALDTTGMVVTASYADNSTADVTSSAAVRGYDKTKAKRQTVTISYGGKKDTFSVTVKEKTGLKSISIDSIPSKTVYYVGDAFDPTGMKVSALYKDGSRDDVTDLVSISFSSRKAGNETVDVRFRGKTESFKVTVQELSITGILVNPEAVILQKNKSLTLKVVAIDANGDKHTVTSKADYASSDPKVASVNGNGKIRGKKAGTAQITLTYRGYSKIVNVIVD